jgi:hypothetical protein
VPREAARHTKLTPITIKEKADHGERLRRTYRELSAALERQGNSGAGWKTSAATERLREFLLASAAVGLVSSIMNASRIR